MSEAIRWKPEPQVQELTREEGARSPWPLHSRRVRKQVRAQMRRHQFQQVLDGAIGNSVAKACKAPQFRRIRMVRRFTHRPSAESFECLRIAGPFGPAIASLTPSTMDPLLISAASGMKSRMDSLDMLANNL